MHPVVTCTCMVVESIASGLGKGGEPSTSTEHRGSVNTAVSCNIKIVIHHSFLKERRGQNDTHKAVSCNIEIVIHYSSVVSPDSALEVNPDTFPVPDPVSGF